MITVKKAALLFVVVPLGLLFVAVFILKWAGVDISSKTSYAIDREQRYCRDAENKIYSVGATRFSMDKTKSIMRCEIGGKWKRANN
jgi:hypothetical protein